MGRHLLRLVELSVIGEIRRDPYRPECVITEAIAKACGLRASLTIPRRAGEVLTEGY